MPLPTPDPAFGWTREPWGPALRCGPLETAAQHLFTSRQLELRPQMLETPAPRMTETTQITGQGWFAATASVGSSVDRLIRVKQVHGNLVRVLRRGEVPEDAALVRPAGDAVVANEPGLVLAVMVADCVPILLADRASGAAAAIHAGWRGTCARVGPAAVEAMRRHFGTEPSNLVAAIGPSIGPDDYEVGEWLTESFQAAGHTAEDLARWFKRRASRLHLDLWSANRDQLIDAGLQAERIFTCGLSTLAHTDVFDSFRSNGERAGRMAALIVVPGPAC